VHFELQTWLALKQSNHLIVLAEGQIAWNDTDFDWNQTTALPHLLSTVFKSQPLYLDVRDKLPKGWEHGDNPTLQSAAVLLAAVIEQQSVKDMESKDRLGGARGISLNRSLR
jgi:hypothetical protein